ncbi:hypothetical protein BBW65_03850 [Helicobacter enhydrae]|uniref:DNA repair protein RecN n=1 Tax=Helicobacter enhydrae TaxID=222136 RepID=A0A1B1U5B0_9HELI|nr:hypothetical protein [Helicobacter enhydrae]ANV97984.1 hypothetical protein BBW65_03850 [Helicobacter enhydrae]
MKIERMLIKKSPAFDEALLYFDKGLNVISGASGAGKSVFFHSLLAIFGLKECNALALEASLEGVEDLGEFLVEDELVLQVFKKDKTRYFLNHQSASKKRFEQIFSPYLKWLSHKNSNELQSDFLLRLLDSRIAGQCVEEYARGFERYQTIQKQLQEVRLQQKNIAELVEFAQFEIERIESVNPKPMEYEELLEYKKRLSKKDKIEQQAFEALRAIEGMVEVRKFLTLVQQEIPHYDEVLCEVEGLILSEKEKLNELNEENAEEVLNRLSAISALIGRYGGVEEALKRLEEQKQKLSSYQNLDTEEKALEEQRERIYQELMALGSKISIKRQEALPSLIAELNALGGLLKLSKIDLKWQEVELHPLGLDALEIVLNDCGCEKLSSGEYNRLRLAVLALSNTQGVLLLDEIDANLSGEESEGVAKVLQKLSKQYQIFAISHQPHLPALADRHFVVQKTEQGSVMAALDDQGRVYEIARMISGSKLSQEALDFAKMKLGVRE